MTRNLVFSLLAVVVISGVFVSESLSQQSKVQVTLAQQSAPNENVGRPKTETKPSAKDETKPSQSTEITVIAKPASSKNTHVETDVEVEAEKLFANKLSSMFADRQQNLVISPFGLYSVLRVLTEGAEGESQHVLLRALGVSSKLDLNQAVNSKLWTEVGRPVVYSTNVLLKPHATGGLVIATPPPSDSPLAIAGLKAGDIVDEVNGLKLTGINAFFDESNSRAGRLRISGVHTDSKERFKDLDVQLIANRKHALVSERSFVYGNILFLRTGSKINEPFQRAVDRLGPFMSFETNFGDDFKSACERANHFLAGCSSDRLKLDSIKPADPAGAPTSFILLSNAGFDQKWRTPLVKREMSAPFETPQGKVAVRYLARQALFRFAENDQVQVVELPFKDGVSRCRLWLPKTSELMDKTALIFGNEKDRSQLLSKMEAMPVDLLVPPFKMESSLESEILTKLLDLGKVFGSEADFSRLSSADPQLARLTQASTIEFTHVGVLARSTTVAVAVAKGGAPTEPAVFHATHPFLFEILETDDVVLFSGIVNEPLSETTPTDNKVPADSKASVDSKTRTNK